MCRVKGSTLVETIVASILFMVIFAVSLELVPRLTVTGRNEVDMIETEICLSRAREKYTTGVWPAGEYLERYGNGKAKVLIEYYRDLDDVVVVHIEIEAGNERITYSEIVECWQ